MFRLLLLQRSNEAVLNYWLLQGSFSFTNLQTKKHQVKTGKIQEPPYFSNQMQEQWNRSKGTENLFFDPNDKG